MRSARRAPTAPARGRPSAASLPVPACLLLAALMLPGSPADAAEPVPGRTVSVVTGSAEGAPPDLSSLAVTVAGTEAPILGVAPVERWEIVVAVVPALSTQAAAAWTAEELAPRVERLRALGDVRLLSVDDWIDEIAVPADAAGDLARACRSIPQLGAFGRLQALRRRAGTATDIEERRQAAREELALVRWQREALVDRLLTAAGPTPKALLLLEDTYDGRLGRAYGLDDPELDASGSSTLDDAVLGAALAAAGWTVFPLQPSESETGEAPASSLATATGGRVITDETDLDTALDMLAGAVEVTLGVEPPPSFPLAIEWAPGGAAEALLDAPLWFDGGHLPGLAATRARRFLTLDEEGSLPVEGRLQPEGPDAASVVIEIAADIGDLGRAERAASAASGRLSAALYVERLDGVPLEVELQGRGESLADVDRWVAQVALPLPVDAVELVAVVSDAATGSWGAARLEEGDGRPARSGPGLVVESYDLRPPSPAGEAGERPAAPTTIVLLAPEGGRLRGRQRFRTLVSTPGIRRVRFYLDGESVGEDDEPPFGARIDLGEAVARHTVEVRAYDAAGALVGSDSIRLNEPFRSLDVSIVDLEIGADRSRIRFEATIDHPTDIAVERVEYYHNEELLTVAEAPPWSFAGPVGTIGSTDYVRVVAYFDDGRFLEDVRLVSSPGSSEEVEVNLVQVYVVATDRQGEPVADLGVDDFRIRLGGEPQEIQRFAYADEVPLELALVIDTSPSMWPLMPDTRKAAARFLTQVVTDEDRALVIDFDTRPRVARPLTGDLGDLLNSLGGLEAEQQGTTALYDSVIFAALELPRGQQRKAIVLLTDGDDYRSRFSLGRAIDTAQQAGVPVYVVSLAGIQDPRRQFRRTDLDTLTGETGGEAYYLAQVGELGPTYAKIARELRSQYLLAFPTARQLSEDDLGSLQVEVPGRGLRLRTVVGGRSVD